MEESIKVPRMGESITQATIGVILKPSGVLVEENEELLELETEKVNQVLYAPKKGILSWSVKRGDTVSIGATIGTIGAATQTVTAATPAEATPSAEPLAAPKIEKVIPKEELIAPNIQALNDTRHSRRPMSALRQTIGKKMVQALHTCAMLTTFNEIDMSKIAEIRNKYKELFVQHYQIKLGLMSFFIKAVVEGLKAFPDLNSFIEDNEIVLRHYYDIGVAVGTQRGVVVPVLRACDTLSFAQIEKQLMEYAEQARRAALSIETLRGGGFTLTNGGVYGSLLSTPIVNPPQAGILGMHKIQKRPVVIDDTITIRPMMYLALSYDHRLIDGKEAVGFLVYIKELLEDPLKFFFLGME